MLERPINIWVQDPNRHFDGMANSNIPLSDYKRKLPRSYRVLKVSGWKIRVKWHANRRDEIRNFHEKVLPRKGNKNLFPFTQAYWSDKKMNGKEKWKLS